ncbi:MAG TPA: hypothetical protein VFE60_28240 [Roseiarcus sp.]|jgi:hypothetical protein|nr:hypothetical protein [Roseiarcus sp.]
MGDDFDDFNGLVAPSERDDVMVCSHARQRLRLRKFRAVPGEDVSPSASAIAVCAKPSDQRGGNAVRPVSATNLAVTFASRGPRIR